MHLHVLDLDDVLITKHSGGLSQSLDPHDEGQERLAREQMLGKERVGRRIQANLRGQSLAGLVLRHRFDEWGESCNARRPSGRGKFVGGGNAGVWILLPAALSAGEEDFAFRHTAFQFADEMFNSFGGRHEFNVERCERCLELGTAGNAGLAPSMPMNCHAAAIGCA